MTQQSALELGELFDAADTPEPGTESAHPDGAAGLYPGQYRLSRIQVVNWGTLSGHHSIDVPRRGLLITGPSGSGKSTLIDAVSSVLMPAGEARFNAAAQETSRQAGRNLVTYIRGAWRREADADSDALTSAYLRPGATWSAVALTYSAHTETTGTAPTGTSTTTGTEANGTKPTAAHPARPDTTLVKLMHIGRGKTSYADVKQLHLMLSGEDAAVELPAFERFCVRGIDTRSIKKTWPGATVHAPYAPFARAFRARLGITGEPAQRLLHRTLSAKSLGSLDQLFREYMLDVPPTFKRADNAVEQFRNLREAHRTVVDARRQIEALTPLVQLAEQRRAGLDDERRLGEEHDHVDAVHARMRLDLLREKRTGLEAKAGQLAEASRTARAEADRAQGAVLDVKTRIEGVGGGRLAVLKTERTAAEGDAERIAARRASVSAALTEWDADAPDTGDGFANLVAQLKAELAEVDAGRPQRRERVYEVQNRKSAVQAELRGLVEDRETLARRRSNLDTPLLRARELVCEQAGLDEDALPFAGELLAVAAEESEWTGPIERVLHGFARTMLVPDTAYDRVAEAVDATHLGARLVYRRVRTRARHEAEPTSGGSLVRKLETKDSPFTPWLLAHLTSRFDYVCVDDAAALRSVRRGVTRAGQIRHGAERHEKDDRSRIDDRSRWVLGFDNEAKLADLRRRIADAEAELDRLEQRARALDEDEVRLRRRETAARTVLDSAWADIDADGARDRIAGLDARIASLTAADSEYAALTAELDRALHLADEAATARSAAESAENSNADALETVQAGIAEAERADTGGVPEPVARRIRARFAQAVRRVTVDNIDKTMTAVVRAIDSGMRTAQQQVLQAEQKITGVLHGYLGGWEERRADLRAEPGYVDDALAVLRQLEAEGLPRYEDDFFGMLRDQSHRNIGELANLIRKAPGEIRTRIEPVNESLSRSPFDVDRTLRIEVKDRRPAVAAEFLADLNRIASGSFEMEGRAAAEERFTAMAALLERLDSGEPADRRWRTQVLDTRGHVGFIGVELDPAGHEVNYHDSSSGLSGGQAQKLVFFCLAAALRYQLADAGEDLPRYATVVLDEAFDRADPAYTRRALDVFDRFGFHMVLATPLKLLQTLEDYIGGVVTVSIADRNRTDLSYLAIEEAGDTGQASVTAGEQP